MKIWSVAIVLASCSCRCSPALVRAEVLSLREPPFHHRRALHRSR